jgi:hypothetical protein
MFTCPECRLTFQTFDAVQAHRLDPYGRKARGEQAKDGRFPKHGATRTNRSGGRRCGPEGYCNARALRGEALARCAHCQGCENAFQFWDRVSP